jgi:hypothetical protein
MAERILKWFQSSHLPPHLRAVSGRFAELAAWIEQDLPECAEKSVALRKLLEAKDAAVRAQLEAGET